MSISVVTITFNNPDDLRLTMRHVDAQSMPPFEHFIIDGSTDGRIKKLLETEPQPSYRKWICEPDRGISDAFNKGILNAQGDIIHLHNAGDYYYDNNVLREVAEAFWENPAAMWLHGKYAQHRGGMWVISGKPYERSKLYRGMRTIGHPTMFLHKELYDKHGLFRLDKKIAMDYDLLVRIADEPFIFLDRPIVYFTPGGVSDRKVGAAVKEALESYYDYKGFSVKAWLWGWRIRLLHKFTGTAVGNWVFQAKNKAKIAETHS
jgi:glycosyltransferase involved in cell wall biosynthesis